MMKKWQMIYVQYMIQIQAEYYMGRQENQDKHCIDSKSQTPHACMYVRYEKL